MKELITVEGIDGAGKSTVVEGLKDRFSEARFTCEPTDSWIGDVVERSISDEGSPLTDFFLFTADHADHLDRVIRPALEDEEVVISDRYVDSRYAYQSVSLRGTVDSPMEWIRSVHDGWTIHPDLTLLLDLDPEIAVGRLGDDKVKYEKVEFLKEVRENYLRLAEDEPQRFVVINASRTETEVVSECVDAVKSYLQDL